MNGSGRISRRVNTLVRSYHFCAGRRDEIMLLQWAFSHVSCIVTWFLRRHTACQRLAVPESAPGSLFKRFCLLCRCFESTRTHNLLTCVRLWRASLLSLSIVSYLAQIFWSGRLLGTILGNLKFINYMDWVDHGWMIVSFPPHCWIPLHLQFSIWAAQTLVHISRSIY